MLFVERCKITRSNGETFTGVRLTSENTTLFGSIYQILGEEPKNGTATALIEAMANDSGDGIQEWFEMAFAQDVVSIDGEEMSGSQVEYLKECDSSCWDA